MSSSNGCRFDEAEHAYYIGDRRVPSVTQCLTMGGLADDYSRIPEHVRAYAAQRGSFVHLACEIYDKALADPAQHAHLPRWLEALDPVIAPYVHGWVKFREREPFVIGSMEYLVYTEEHGGLAGTLDRGGIWAEKEDTILDLKTGKTVGWNVAHQLAAYAWLYFGPGFDLCKIRRQVVHLHDDGTYTLPPPYTDASDLDEFLAALMVTHAKLRHGAKL